MVELKCHEVSVLYIFIYPQETLDGKPNGVLFKCSVQFRTHTVYTTVYTARPGPPATRVPRTHTSTLNSDDHKLNLCRGGPSARQVSVLDCLRWRQRST